MANEDQSRDTPEEGPGGTPVGWLGVIPGAIILVGLSVLCLYSLVALWPHPTPSGSLEATATTPETSATDTSTTDTSATDTSATDTSATSAANITAPPPARPASEPANAGKTTAKPTRPLTSEELRAREKKRCLETYGDDEDGRDECACLERVRDKRERYKLQHEKEGLVLKDDPSCVNIFGRSRLIWNETRLILIVMLSGFLGSLVYSLRSFFWYTGNRELKWSWLLMYLLVPFVGGMLAVIFYMLLRGGLFSPTTTIADTSPFGFAAIAALVGMFINQASEKLRTVFETLMTEPAKGGDATKHKGRDAGTVPPPTLQSVSPSPIPPGVDSTLSIKGAGFTQASVVSANDEKLTSTFKSANELSALLPAKLATNGSTIGFIVSTPDAGKSSEVKVIVSAPTSPP